MYNLTMFTARHDLSEDRIRLTAQDDNDEHRCSYWLTRRLTKNLLMNSQSWLTQQYAANVNVPSHAQDDLYNMYHDQAKDSFQQQQVMSSLKPVKDCDQVKLLRQVEIQKLNENQVRLNFFSGKEAEAFSVMTVEYFHQFLHILQMKSDELGWELAATTSAKHPQYALQ